MTEVGQIKLLARITALEILVEHLLFVAFDRNHEELRAYRERVLSEYAESTLKGFDPAYSDALMQELSEALDRLLSHLIERAEAGQQPPPPSSAPGSQPKD
jgi:hypothetical protein